MKNIIVSNPKVGDILFLDEQNRKRFIALDTYESATFDPRYTIVGVVAVRQGNQVLVVHKTSTTHKWAEIMQFKASGFQLDGSPHETTIKFHPDQQQPSQPVFTYTATTIDEVVEQLNAWCEVYYAESKLRYHAVKCDEQSLYVQKEPYESWKEYTMTMSALTCTLQTGQKLNASSSTYAMNGVGGEYKGINWDRYYQYIHDATSSTFNPAKPISSLGTYPLSYASYSNEIGAFARNIYGEGEEGYVRYLKDYMIRFPSMRGIFAEEFRSGKENTYKQSGDMYLAYDGTMKEHYPAFSYCASVEYPSAGLERGNWYLPSMYEILKVWSILKLDYSDPVNRSLVAIGGTRLYLTSYTWSSCRCYSDYAWLCNNVGCSSVNVFYGRYYAVPFVLLDLSGSEEL